MEHVRTMDTKPQKGMGIGKGEKSKKNSTAISIFHSFYNRK